MAAPETSGAEAAVGSDDTASDWNLRPEVHAGLLPGEAGPLRRILQSPEIKSIVERYNDKSKEAGLQQRRYRRARALQVTLAVATGLTGVFALSLHVILAYVPDFQPLIVVTHLLLLGLLVVVSLWLKAAQPRTKWMAARNEAEQLRIAHFDRVLAQDQPPIAGELPLLPLKLAYFRRYQLDVQLRFFEGRGAQLTRVRWYSKVLPWVTGFSALLVCVFGFAFIGHLAYEHGMAVPDWVVLMTRMPDLERWAIYIFPLLVFSTLYALVSSHDRVSEDVRTGSMYLAARKNLDVFKTVYDDVRKKAEAGDAVAVNRYAALVHGLLIAVQAQWISVHAFSVHGKGSLLAQSSAVGLAELFASEHSP